MPPVAATDDEPPPPAGGSLAAHPNAAHAAATVKSDGARKPRRYDNGSTWAIRRRAIGRADLWSVALGGASRSFFRESSEALRRRGLKASAAAQVDGPDLPFVEGEAKGVVDVERETRGQEGASKSKRA
jgi:hypothetical protein